MEVYRRRQLVIEQDRKSVLAHLFYPESIGYNKPDELYQAARGRWGQHYWLMPVGYDIIKYSVFHIVFVKRESLTSLPTTWMWNEVDSCADVRDF